MSDTIVADLNERKADCAKLRAYFLQHAGEELTTDELRKVGGHNFQQRISEIRRGVDGQPCWDVRCLPQYLWGEKVVRGKTKLVKLKRIEGKWIYIPHRVLGASAEQKRFKPGQLPLLETRG